MINKLRNLNESLIIKYKDKKDLLQKQLYINQIINDDKCFFKMNIETAYSILKDLQIPKENIKETYMNLIDSKNF